jgi:nucleoside-diphosphate-sugar epimerase
MSRERYFELLHGRKNREGPILLGAVRAAELDHVVVVAGSSGEYGPSKPEEIPIKEDAPLRPASPYGVSKAATTLLALQYHCAFGMGVVDEPVVVGDNSRLRALGWAPRVALDQSLARILDYWRSPS